MIYGAWLLPELPRLVPAFFRQRPREQPVQVVVSTQQTVIQTFEVFGQVFIAQCLSSIQFAARRNCSGVGLLSLTKD